MEALLASVLTAAVTVVVEYIVRELLAALRAQRATTA